MESLNVFLLIGTGLMFMGLLFGSLSTRIGVPTLLAFIGVGIVAGDGGLGIRFENVDLAFVISNLALAIILLDGGLRTKLESFRVALRPSLTLATLGVVIPSMLTGLFATWLLGLDWRIGLLLGGIIGSTDAAAVFSMVRSSGVRLNDRVSSTLEMESGLNDPMAIFITVLLIDLLTKPGANLGWESVVTLIQQFGVGGLMGIGFGIALAELLVRLRGNEGLHALLLCTGGLAVWSITNMLGGSGFLAAYVAGLIAGNWRQGTSDNVLRSMDSLAWLSQSGMFLLLGLLVTPSDMLPSLLPGLCIALFLMLIARPAAIFLLLWPFNYPKIEKIFISWTGLRGAVPIVLAVFPLMAGIEQSDMIFNVVFVVVIASLLLQGTTLGPFARYLNLALPPAADSINEISLAGLKDRYVVQLPVTAGSKADGRLLKDIIPASTHVFALIRAGRPVDLTDESTLQGGDILSIITNRTDQENLSEALQASVKQIRDFYGDFTVNASVLVGELLESYGLDGIGEASRSLSLDQYFRARHRGKPVLGDTLHLSGLSLRVRAIKDGHITFFGIQPTKSD